jgi:hypothetical protein
MKQSQPSSKPSSREQKGASSSRPDWRTACLILGAIMMIVLLNGCATCGAHPEYGPYDYNPITGYPAIGGYRWYCP